MDASNLQHLQHQQQQGMMGTHTLEDVLNCTPTSKEQQKRSLMNKPQPEALKCPRCDSSNTKFCYYNNYSLTQPRYFCKACRRYWTKGGSLRNVPVGGGCRKNNKRISSCSSSSAATSKAKSSSSSSISSHHHHQQDINNPNQIYLNTNNSIINNPLLTYPSYDTNDLTLAFGRLHKQQPTTTRQFGFDHDHDHQTSYGNGNTSSIIGSLIHSASSNNNTNSGFIDALRSGFLDPSSGLHNFYSGYGNGISMGDYQAQHQQQHHHHHHQQQRQQQVESHNNGGNCHEDDDDHDSHREQVVLPNYEEEIGLTSTTSSTITTSTKQELFKDTETKLLWNNFPWQGQFGGEQGGNNNHHHHHQHNNMGSVIDHSSAGRDWNNGFNGSSNWHGLVNSPLM